MGNEAILIDGVCLGEAKSKEIYYASLFKAVIEKSKLVDLEGSYFNPFEINSINSELSMMPTFSYRLQTFQKSATVLVNNRILFCPSKSLFEIYTQLRQNGRDLNQANQLLLGQKIKINYPGWYRYFKITKILDSESLDTYVGVFEGIRCSLAEYFRLKYPYIEIKNPG